MPQTEYQKREARRAAVVKWRKANLERQRQFCRDWYAKNGHSPAQLERRKARHKQEYANRREELLRKNKEWRDANKAALAASQKRYREANREKRNARMRAWSRRPEVKVRMQAYRRAHRAETLARVQARKALKLASAVNLRGIEAWMRQVRAKPFARCYYCQRRIATDGASLHFDHIVALSKGGPHSVENLCTSCPDCNLSKGDTPVRLWIRTGQGLLEL